MLAEPDLAVARLDPLRKLHGHEQVDAWQQMAVDGAFAALAESLMAVHYDPLYRRNKKRATAETLDLDADALEPDAMAATARVLAGHLTGLAERMADVPTK